MWPKRWGGGGEHELTLCHVVSRDPSTGQWLPGSALQRPGKVDESSALPAGRRDGVNQKQNYHLFALLLLPFRKSSVLKKGSGFTEAEVTLGAGEAAGTDWLPAGALHQRLGLLPGAQVSKQVEPTLLCLMVIRSMSAAAEIAGWPCLSKLPSCHLRCVQ